MDPVGESKNQSDGPGSSPSLGDSPHWSLHHLGHWRIAKRSLQGNDVYMLLAFVPIGILAGVLELSPLLVFTFNLLAIIPLAVILSAVTEDLSVNVRQSIGALLNATFGNAVELIVSIVALTRGEIRLVQASMLGAILSNILLGLGCCFVVGGYLRDCHFNVTAAQTMSSLMVVASTSLIIPAALNLAFDDDPTVDSSNGILILSRGTSIVLLVLYVMYLYFQLRTHSRLFEQTKAEIQSARVDVRNKKPERALTPRLAIAALSATTIVTAVCAEYLLGTVNDLVDMLNINKTFIGLIILPIVGNAAEQVTAVAAARKDKLDLALGVALGSSLQIALFVTPSLVVVGWIINQPMSLCFPPFDAVVFFLSVLVVNGLVMDGESNYLEGGMLVGTYIIIAISFYVYPEKAHHLEPIPSDLGNIHAI